MVAIAVLQDTFRMAFRDELTGIPSRRALNERLAALGNRYTIAMLDVDHFKNFNDTYGHDLGDQVLKMVAAHIAGVGGGGKAFRYGGEEFTVLFPGNGRRGGDPAPGGAARGNRVVPDGAARQRPAEEGQGQASASAAAGAARTRYR